MSDAIADVSVTHTKADFTHYVRILGREMNLFVYRLIAVVVTGMSVFALEDWLSGQLWVRHHILDNYYIPYMAFIAGVFVIVFGAVFRLLTRNVEYVGVGQDFLRPKRIHIDERGVRETSEVSDRFTAWAGISRMDKTRHYLLFYIDRMTAFVIPVRDFASPAAASAFYERAQALRKAAGSPASPP
jgi:YcxB-like protein